MIYSRKVEEKTTFIDMLSKIQEMAYGLCKKWRFRFSVNELVNEAWIKSLEENHTSAPLIMMAAKLDMIDYIRTQVGRENVDKSQDKKCKYYRKKGRIKFFTNCELKDDENIHADNILDVSYIDKNFMVMENNEIIEKLLSLYTPSQKHTNAMTYYYLHSKSLVQTGEMIGLRDTTVCNLLKKSIIECKTAIKCMDLEYAEI